MSIVSSKTFKRATNFAFAFVIAVSTLTAAMPFVFSNNVSATTYSVTPSDDLQTKINDAAAGDVLNIAPGNYPVSNVNINKKLTLNGAPGARLIVNPGVGATVNALNITANDVTVTGLEIKGEVSPSYIVYYTPPPSTTSRGITVSQGVTGFSIIGNNIHDVRNGVLIDGRNSTGTLSNNVIEDTKGAVSIQYTDASALTVTGNSQGPIGNAWGFNLHLNGNFDGTTTHSNPYPGGTAPTGVQSAILALKNANGGLTVQDQAYQKANRTDVNVATTGTAGGQGDLLGKISTIQLGADAIVAGGTVKVAAGTYNEAVTIIRAGTFVGAGAGIDARSRSIAETVVTTVGTSSNFTANADDVTIDGFTLNGPTGDSAALRSFGAYTGFTAQNNIINNASRAVMFNTSNILLTRNRVNTTGTATYIDGFEENSNAANNVAIVGNDFYDGNNGGGSNADISFIGATSATSTGVAIVGNKSFNGATLLNISNTTGATVAGNEATNPVGSAFYIGGNNLDIALTGNIVSDATARAVRIANDFGYGVNTIAPSHYNQFATTNTNGVVVNPNAIAAGTTADFTLNWWGNASGPLDVDAADGSTPASNAGTGTTAIGAVNYGPWCTVADCATDSDDLIDDGDGSGSGGGGGTEKPGDKDKTPPTRRPAFVTPGITSPASVLGNETNGGDTDVDGATDTKTEQQKGFDGTIAGIAWYWWLLALAVLGGGSWWVVGAIRRRNDESSSSK